MVPRISRPGCSFTGAWKYYAHDKRTAAQQEEGQEVRTRERVAFVHAENLGGIEDDRAAIGLMIDTARQSKRCEKPVYAFSLAWHPDEETPDKAQMIDAGREALKVLGMQDHQALMMAHTDTAHWHVHVIVNRVHPETGKAINLYKDREKLSAWALEHERKHGKVYCQAREFKALARQAAKEQDSRPAPRLYVDNTLAECWSRSDSGKSFKAALEAKGWGLARGDRKENVLMTVTPSGRAFAVLRELNKGLSKGQTIKAADFDRKTEDLKREELRTVREVQQEIERRARSRSGEKSRQQQQVKPRRAEQGQKPARPDEGKAWALEMRIREERRALDERQAQAKQRQQDAAQARLEKARAEAMKAQQVQRQEQALREAQERLKRGGLLYRMSRQAQHDREAQAELPERLKQSMDRVNNWVERERRSVTQDAEAFAHQQQVERAKLETKIEDARKLGEWREREQPHAPSMETGERHEHGRGLGGGQGGGGREW